MAGFVYVMSNPGFDGRVKIGKSIKDPTMDRVEELNSTTSVPEPFKVEYYCYVDKFDQLEARVHRLLDNYRPNKRREFFQIDLLKAVTTIQGIASELGGIKFEEFYFDTDILSEGNSDGDDYLKKLKSGLFGTQGSYRTEELTKQYPKAAKVLEYNENARSYFDKLAAVPGDIIKDFLEVLENEPSISDEDLEKLFETPAYKQHFQPFDSLVASYFYNLCLEENMNMALEFKNDFELLSPRFTATKIFQKLCSKYRIQTEKFDVDDLLYFRAISSTISNLKSVSLKDLKALFSEINLNVTFMTTYYTISHNGVMLFDYIPKADLLAKMTTNLFSPTATVFSGGSGPIIEKASKASDTYAAEKILNEVGYKVLRPLKGAEKYIICSPDGVETKIDNLENFFKFLGMEAKRFLDR